VTRWRRLSADSGTGSPGADREPDRGLVLVLLVVAWFVPAVRPLVALAVLVMIVRGAEIDYELSMRRPR
jgi:hypothetical protein